MVPINGGSAPASDPAMKYTLLNLIGCVGHKRRRGSEPSWQIVHFGIPFLMEMCGV